MSAIDDIIFEQQAMSRELSGKLTALMEAMPSPDPEVTTALQRISMQLDKVAGLLSSLQTQKPPQVNVAAPQVSVNAPAIDLNAVASALSRSLSKSLEGVSQGLQVLIDKPPVPVIPEQPKGQWVFEMERGASGRLNRVIARFNPY